MAKSCEDDDDDDISIVYDDSTSSMCDILYVTFLHFIIIMKSPLTYKIIRDSC